MVSPYLIFSSLFISATVDMTDMNCQLKAITMHVAAWDIPNVSSESHCGSGIFCI